MLEGVLSGRTFLLRLALLQPIKMESSASLANKSPTNTICFSSKFGCNTSHSVSPPSPVPLSNLLDGISLEKLLYYCEMFLFKTAAAVY